ncbi:phospholipase D-like domain-containing protein [Gryllotalpicola ginsengisoli]|uniref:phospholipase D-like domain-containing protein n=1 Tax=Gryllotalpicola ginsengisoli TaxID=444608 RepID=UPI0003B74C7D|nr:phospholipase D-like domain-containing protein [Gryllotalpicola ginsengisoli]
MASSQQPNLSDLITAHLDEFRLPGVLSVRPGFEAKNGWLTGRPAIVVTVSGPRPHGLPDEVEGVPVDVRTASERKRAALLAEPGAAARRPAAPDEGAVPEFDDEVVLAPQHRGHPQGPGHPEHPQHPQGPQHPEHTRHEPPAPEESAPLAKPTLPYQPPAGAALSPVSGELTVQLAASPDAGWGQLQPFLAATKQELVIGLYDFTSKHVLDAFETALKGKKVTLTLDHPSKNPTADQTDEQTVAELEKALGDDFEQAWALSGMDPKATATIFQTAYHIKVAARDGETTWLSSGNWNNSNQPDIDPVKNSGDADAARDGDRDWHVVIQSPELTKTFAAYLQNDYEVASQHNESDAEAEFAAHVLPRAQTPPFARFFPAQTVTGQMTITPLLTPDAGVYVDAVTKLVASATKTLHMQFQYIELPKTTDATNQAFVDLVSAVAARQKAGVEVRIIMSQYETLGYLEKLQALGLDTTNDVKLQNNVHNKGIVVDGRAVLVSSQNWSSAGVLHNRDAGVIIENADAAAYFEQIFAHDWEHLAAQKASED